MVANIQQAAYCYYLFAQHFPYGKFKSVLQVYAHGRNALSVALQNLVVQGVYRVKLLHAVCPFEEHYAFLVPLDYFGLVTVFLVTRAPLLKQFTQIVFIELYQHNALLLLAQR